MHGTTLHLTLAEETQQLEGIKEEISVYHNSFPEA